MGLDRQVRTILTIPSTPLKQRLRAGLAELALARQHAVDVRVDPWTFAIDIHALLALGLTKSDLRWLAEKGYVEHACEVTGPRHTARRFRPEASLAFSMRTRFILSQTGQLATAEIADGREVLPRLARITADDDDSPHWDANARVLSVGGRAVKEYHVPSRNQEAVLAAFEEEGWPRIIDDPLVPADEQHPQHRLRETIKSLNASQKLRLIRFRGDGTGRRVFWEPVDETAADLVPPLRRRLAA